MQSTASTVLVTLLIAAVILTAGALAFVYSGVYNVAATQPHSAVTRWLLATAREKSIDARAEKAGEIPAISDEQRAHGVEHYVNTCVACHGAPGIERGELGKGITPTPPDLAKVARERSGRELFWAVKHGIKFTGMPAFGPTHSDDELWGLVSFLRLLPDLTPQQYQRLAAGIDKKRQHASRKGTSSSMPATASGGKP